MNRRNFNQSIASLLPASAYFSKLYGQFEQMPTRPIHSSGESLPLVGFGSSKLVSLIQELGPSRMREVLSTLKSYGGSVVDTWPRNPVNDGVFGDVINEDEFRESLFITSKIDRIGKSNGEQQFDETLQLYKRSTIDLAQIFSLTDVYTHWETLLQLKEEGKARYIGVTVSQYELYDDLLAFLTNHQPDFIQVNYSISERLAESRIIPFAYDRGISIIVNRPFMNGQYFQALANTPLPDWSYEFNCHTWAEFSLKYIFANPMITCVLTETSNPLHMMENAGAALGVFPDSRQLQFMSQFIDTI
jgi:diketogulonate reductase-like aldo/keto reductase